MVACGYTDLHAPAAAWRVEPRKEESAASACTQECVCFVLSTRNQLLDPLAGWSGPPRVVLRSAASQPPLPVTLPIKGVMGAGAVHNHAPTGLAAVPPRAATPSGGAGGKGVPPP